MKLLFDSHHKHFLEMYEPDIVFLDEVHVAEDPEAVQWYLDEWGLTKEDLKNAGLRVTKNTITISKGTPAIVVSMHGNIDSMYTIFRIKNIEIEFPLTMIADFVLIEATPQNKELEFLDTYTKKLPTKNDTTELYGYRIFDIMEALTYYYQYDNKRYGFEDLKVTPKEDLVRTMTRWQNLQNYNAAQKIDFDI